jgi:hypothetical protein
VVSVAVVWVPAAAPAACAAVQLRPARAADVPAPIRGDGRPSAGKPLARYAGAVTRAVVRALPRSSAGRVSHLHYLTEDGTFEVYPVLESHVDSGGHAWLRIRLPMRPNGRTGWVPRNDLGPIKTVATRRRVNRATLRATLYRRGRRIWSSPIGIGKAATPTPAGFFWIRSRLRGLRSNPVYGPYAFGTGAYSALSDWPGGGVVGIHGTDQPQLIPGRPSHGCIRVPNPAVRRLWRLMPIGTPVEIV